jgi:hypothetical protein
MTTAELRQIEYADWGFGRRLLRAMTQLVVRPYRRLPPARAKVAIVVPLSSRPELLPDEEISLRQLCHYLGKYEKFLLVPTGSPIQREGFTTVHFPPQFFGSLSGHCKLGYWPNYFKTFSDYEYVLIYHPDALVFSDDLAQWCEAGWDYIGAPWLPGPDSEWVKEPTVGNGGFALMKVDACLEALHTRHREDPLTVVLDVLMFHGHRFGPVFRFLDSLKRFFPRSRMVNWPLERWEHIQHPNDSALSADLFWGLYAKRYLPTFKVAPVEEALRFAFEASPRQCFEMNDQQLPFGCHAWAKYDRAFWQPYLVLASSQTDNVDVSRDGDPTNQ